MAATASCCFSRGRCCCTALERACWVLKAEADEKDYPDTLQLSPVTRNLSCKWGRSYFTVIGVRTHAWASTRAKDMLQDAVIKPTDTLSVPCGRVEYLAPQCFFFSS